MKTLIYILLFLPFLSFGQREVDLTTTPITQLLQGVISFEIPHAFIFFQDSTREISVNGGAFSQITNPANDLFTVGENEIVSVSGDTLFIDWEGDYLILYCFGLTGGNLDVYRIQCNNGLMCNGAMSGGTSVQVPFTTIPGIVYAVDLTASDFLLFEIANITDNDNPTMLDGLIFIMRMPHI